MAALSTSLTPFSLLRRNTHSKNCHFFSAFQRYISLSVSSRIQPQPNDRSLAPPNPSIKRRPRPHQTPRRLASTNTSPHQTTHYTLFPSTLAAGPPPSGPFKINLEALKREFLQLQAKAHPDRHSGPNKARAEGTSALINEAYKTLQSPLLRAQYLLSLQGIDIAEDETAKIDDEALLMEVMEAREAIEGAQEERDLDGLKRDNEERILRSEGVLADLCREGDWDAIKDEAVRLRYWVNIREALQGWERGKPVVIHH